MAQELDIFKHERQLSLKTFLAPGSEGESSGWGLLVIGLAKSTQLPAPAFLWSLPKLPWDSPGCCSYMTAELQNEE